MQQLVYQAETYLRAKQHVLQWSFAPAIALRIIDLNIIDSPSDATAVALNIMIAKAMNTADRPLILEVLVMYKLSGLKRVYGEARRPSARLQCPTPTPVALRKIVYHQISVLNVASTCFVEWKCCRSSNEQSWTLLWKPTVSMNLDERQNDADSLITNARCLIMLGPVVSWKLHNFWISIWLILYLQWCLRRYADRGV